MFHICKAESERQKKINDQTGIQRFCVKKGMVLLDGATGSNLMSRGMPGGVCPEKWITENPDVLTGLQKEYVSAGTDILYAPTFTANRFKLAEYGLEGNIRELNLALVAASRRPPEKKRGLPGI